MNTYKLIKVISENCVEVMCKNGHLSTLPIINFGVQNVIP